jgi:hypothetical protein
MRPVDFRRSGGIMRLLSENICASTSSEGMVMSELPLRLGDLIDDYCPRCRLLLNHAIASMVEGQVAKVICQTCYSEHAYQHGQGGKKKPGPRTTLFDQVLAKVTPSSAAPQPPAARRKVAVPPPPKKPAAAPARYILRHKTKPPRSGL